MSRPNGPLQPDRKSWPRGPRREQEEQTWSGPPTSRRRDLRDHTQRLGMSASDDSKSAEHAACLGHE
ncbi:hypothetical protein Ancab_028632 [Ancistrocladus abbreviatus]